MILWFSLWFNLRLKALVTREQLHLSAKVSFIVVNNIEQYITQQVVYFFGVNRTLLHLSGFYHELGFPPKSNEDLLYLARHSYEQA